MNNKKNDMKIFTHNVGPNAMHQIHLLINLDAFQNSKIRIMPDVHVGKHCVIGFTATIKDKIIPNIVGVDIGCGMFCANLGQIDIDYRKLDHFINNNISHGRGINKEKIIEYNIEKLFCYEELQKIESIQKSIGSLGGGNHFIEIDEGKEGEKYLVIHTGSRNLGAQVANYYQKLANALCNSGILDYRKKRLEIIDNYKKLGKENEIQEALTKLDKEYNAQNTEPKVPYEYAYLEGKYRDAYLHDMKICQEYAKLNRYTIAKRIADYMGWKLDNYFESVHNYISFEDNIVRKGAISAKEGEQVIIPINMRDGCIIGVGKGNADWNYSAPHGAGRIMSRTEALSKVSLEDYKESMKDIYTTSVDQSTIDESPFAYKPMTEILENIIPTVEVKTIIKPKYNFKASEVRIYDKEDDIESSKKL